MALTHRRGRGFIDVRLGAMMGLFFLVVCAVGILRPIKNSLALDGLGATDFYKVYLISAAVMLFVPLFTRAADRVPWRWLIPGLALFFAANLVVFRILYVEGSATFGILFYGWYDLFAAALVAQFFMTTQLYFDARSARRAYPIVIAGGSIGATLGGAITGFFAESVGTPNLLLVAAGMIVLFSVAMPVAWGNGEGATSSRPDGGVKREDLKGGELRRVFGDPHVRLIAATVLLTIVVKQLVDYQFNAITKDVFETRDAVAAFQGKFNAATQWMPLVVLVSLRPALRRWGVVVAVMLLPLAMFATTAALAVAFGLWAAVAAKGSETALRYSAERAGREILYVPVPDEIKLKAKAYIDVAVEKGLGKVLSAVLLAGLMTVMPYRHVAWVSLGLAAGWVVLAMRVHREYLRTLARSIEGRFASLRGLSGSLVDPGSLPVLRASLGPERPLQAAFTLELLSQSPSADVGLLAPELNRLLESEDGTLRAAALDQLARSADRADLGRVRGLLDDEDASVAEAALRVLLGRRDVEAGDLMRELLASERPSLRMAVLRHLVREGRLPVTRLVGREYIEARWPPPAHDAAARAELALATAGLHDDPDADRFLTPFLDDADPRVRTTALRSAALLGRAEHCARMIEALDDPATREPAQDALATLGTAALEPLARTLLDTAAPPRVRRAVPSVLARIGDPRTADVLLDLILAPETDQLLDHRATKALSKLRAQHPEIRFDPVRTWRMAEEDLAAALRYAALLGAPAPTEDAIAMLLRAAAGDGWRARRETVFRCIGLLHPPGEVYRAYVGTTGGSARNRANALEWLEHALGHARYRQFAPLLENASPFDVAVPPGTTADLEGDTDSWIALLWRLHAGRDATPKREAMELIEKVLLLQRVDLLQGVRGAQLALLAEIADEIAFDEGATIIASGETPTAMYVVTRGSVALHGMGAPLRLGEQDAFGTWSLIDDQASPLEARALEPTRLLRIRRTDFHDLVTDHPELSLALLQGLARRMRTLVA